MLDLWTICTINKKPKEISQKGLPIVKKKRIIELKKGTRETDALISAKAVRG